MEFQPLPRAKKTFRGENSWRQVTLATVRAILSSPEYAVLYNACKDKLKLAG